MSGAIERLSRAHEVRQVLDGTKDTPQPAVRYVLDPSVGYGVLVAAMYNAGKAGIRKHEIQIGDAPVIALARPELPDDKGGIKIATGPNVTVLATSFELQVSAYGQTIGTAQECEDSHACEELAGQNLSLIQKARRANAASESEESRASLRALAANYDWQQTHKLVHEAVAKAVESEGKAPSVIHLALDMDMPVVVINHMQVMRCRQWTDDFVMQSRIAEKWACPPWWKGPVMVVVQDSTRAE